MKEKIILFGAGQGGINHINHQGKYDILAIADNDSKKHNTKVQGKIVIPPEKIKDYKFDYIVIASMFFNEIKDQLLNELNYSEKVIKVAPKATMKAVYRPFEDKKTMSFLKNKLSQLIELLNDSEINYFVDFGTLLGAVRDQTIIPWDDDVDLSVLNTDLNKLILFIENNLCLLNEKDIKWQAYITYKKNNTPTNVSLKFEGGEKTGINRFQINIAIVEVLGKYAVQELNKVPKRHFIEREFIDFLNTKISVPYNYKKYLELTYGDWKTPKKDTDYSEYNLLKDVSITPKRVLIELKQDSYTIKEEDNNEKNNTTKKINPIR